MTAIKCVINCEGQRLETVSTNLNFWRSGEPKQGMEPTSSAYQPDALPLGHTISLEPLMKDQTF